MRVIHGIWAHGALCLWAEDPDLPSVPPVPPPPAAAARLLRPHPFACQAAELADLLASWPGSPGSPGSVADAARKAIHDELTLQLPSAGGGPLASPELVRPGALTPARGGRVALASWRVPVLAFDATAALELLGGLV